MNFLWQYFREGERLDWDEARFDETFAELQAELRTKSVVVHTTRPLSQLKMEVDSLAFGEELELMAASKRELERWLNRDQSLGPLSPGPPQWTSRDVDRPAVLHSRQTIFGRPLTPEEIGLPGPRIDVTHAISALRLVLDAPISVVFAEQTVEGLMGFGGVGTSWSPSPSSFGPWAILDDDKARQVISVWKLLQISPNVDLLSLPLRRWESSLLRGSLEDKLIDAWIALEALLMPGITSELTHRAALRLAELLGQDGMGRQKVYDETQDSYRWRSKIVHGSAPKTAADREKLTHVVQVTTERLRQALLKVLDMPSRFDPGRLEANLLGRESGS